VLYLGPRRLQLGCSFHFECLLFYCPHLLFFALSISLGKTAKFDSNKVSHPLAKWHNARRPGVAVGLSLRGNVLVDLRAGWALCGRGCILSMDLGWPGAYMNSTKQAVVTTTRDKVSLGPSEHDYWNASWILELINCEDGLSLNLGSATGGTIQEPLRPIHVVLRFYSGTCGSFFERMGINNMPNLAYTRLDNVPLWSLGCVQIKANTGQDELSI